MKPLLIQTTPHTGTHTAMYLFHYLGGIPAFYHHLGDWELSKFLSEFHDFRERFTIVHTARLYHEIVDTYKRRTPEYASDPDHVNSAENLVKRNLAVEEKWHREFSEAIVLPIGGNVELQTAMAKIVFKACEVPIPTAARPFLETWEPKGTFPTGEQDDFRGFDSVDEQKAMGRLMGTQRIMPKNDWRDKVNLALKELSN